MVTLRRIAFVLLLVCFMLAAAIFAYSNPQPIAVDIGLTRFEQVPMAAAFAVVFVCGWVLGVVSAAIALWRSAGEKRRLRRDLHYAETELSGLRQVSADDAN